MPSTTPRKPDPAWVAIGAWADQDGSGLSHIELIVCPTEDNPETILDSRRPRRMRNAMKQAVAAPCRLLGWGVQSFDGCIDAWASYVGGSSGPSISRVPGNTLIGRIFMAPTGGALLVLRMQSPAISPE